MFITADAIANAPMIISASPKPTNRFSIITVTINLYEYGCNLYYLDNHIHN